MIVGAVGAVVTILSKEGLPRYLKIDDPVGTVSIHGAAGIWGVLAVSLFAHQEITEEQFIPETGYYFFLALKILDRLFWSQFQRFGEEY